MPITLLLGVQHDLVREGIGFASGDGGYMVLVAVHDGDNLHRRLLQRAFHRSSDLYALCTVGHKSAIGLHSSRQHAACFGLPPSVFGLAIVTSTSHSSHTTSSSLPLPMPVNQPLFLRFLSKNWTAICPLTPPLGVLDEVS